MTPAATLRKLLAGGEPVIAPGAFGPLVGRLVAEAGFPAVYLSGAGLAGGLYGQPDVGLVTMTEVVEAARATVETSGLPVICDADTGYGGVLNVRRTVMGLEAAGVAALHIEDQEFPKRCGFLDGHSLVDAGEMVARLKAALDARRDTDLLIIARTEMLGAGGIGETIDRACRYREAGADMIFCNGILSEADAERLAREIPGPHLYNVSTSGRTPHLAPARLRALGYALVIYPAHTLFLAVKAIRDMLDFLKAEGTLAPLLDRMIDFAEWKRLTGILDMEARERRYLP
jgi:2-methylisocitrate lyase-like PEP mutase family enzyme